MQDIFKARAAAGPARLLMQQAPGKGRPDFFQAPNCTEAPTANTSTPDDSAHLWGWNTKLNASCAFKDGKGNVMWYPDYEPASWLHTPPCSSPPFGNESVVDSSLKVSTAKLNGCMLGLHAWHLLTVSRCSLAWPACCKQAGNLRLLPTA